MACLILRRRTSSGPRSKTATDSRQLHKLISNLINEQVNTKWPPHKDIQSLANNFTDYFETKILKIREAFMTTPAYVCEETHVPRLTKFEPSRRRKSGKW